VEIAADRNILRQNKAGLNGLTGPPEVSTVMGENFKWFVRNRRQLRMRATKGSARAASSRKLS
jgi:hypothetical protein